MRDAPLSICERNFIAKSIKQDLRLDGRKHDEFRKVNINFGARWGSVVVTMGETKVVGEVTCDLTVPKPTRPTEGDVFINVELRSMSMPTLDSHTGEMFVKLNRTLERTFRESRCVDLESLCVIAEERVWTLRVNLVALNNDGNLIDCCSVATLAALAHFKRPDVSIVEDDLVIYTAAEKELIPLVLHHYPVCVSYSTFDDGRIAIADPTGIEERAAESQMIFGLNSLQELCCFNLGGSSLTSSLLLLQCAKRASIHAKDIVKQVKADISNDAELRSTTKHASFAQNARKGKMTTLIMDDLSLRVRNFSLDNINKSLEEKEAKTAMESESDAESEKEIVFSKDMKTAVLVAKHNDLEWIPEDSEADDVKQEMSSGDDDEDITEQKMEEF